MSESLVIDSNVLAFAAGGHGDNDRTTACVEIIFGIMNSEDLSFALDTEGKILEEYKRNLTEYRNPHTKVIQEFFQKQMRIRDGISFIIPLRKSQVEELANEGFHEKDLIFVRIAPETESQCIASCDSRSLLNEDYQEWIENELDVTVHPPEDFKQNVDSL